MPGLKQKGIALYHWLDRRLGLVKPATEAAEHPIPASSASWWYVFGSAASVILMMQVVTGILLALVYTPTARDAWNSLNFLNHGLTLGWFLRALHGWGSDFMIAIVLIHMTQVFMFGAYKFPRELTWIVGVFLLLLTLGMAFTGQVLRFDQDAEGKPERRRPRIKNGLGCCGHDVSTSSASIKCETCAASFAALEERSDALIPCYSLPPCRGSAS